MAVELEVTQTLEARVALPAMEPRRVPGVREAWVGRGAAEQVARRELEATEVLAAAGAAEQAAALLAAATVCAAWARTALRVLQTARAPDRRHVTRGRV